MPTFSRETAYHEAAHVAAWHLEDRVQVDVTLDPKNPRVTVTNRLPSVATTQEGIHRAYIKIRAGMAGAFAERMLLDDHNAWLPATRGVAPSPSDASAGDFYVMTQDIDWAIGQHGLSPADADALYAQVVAELTVLFRDRAFTDRICRLGDYLATLERQGHVMDKKLREVEEGYSDE